MAKRGEQVCVRERNVLRDYYLCCRFLTALCTMAAKCEHIEGNKRLNREAYRARARERVEDIAIPDGRKPLLLDLQALTSQTEDCTITAMAYPAAPGIENETRSVGHELGFLAPSTGPSEDQTSPKMQGTIPFNLSHTSTQPSSQTYIGELRSEASVNSTTPQNTIKNKAGSVHLDDGTTEVLARANGPVTATSPTVFATERPPEATPRAEDKSTASPHPYTDIPALKNSNNGTHWRSRTDSSGYTNPKATSTSDGIELSSSDTTARLEVTEAIDKPKAVVVHTTTQRNNKGVVIDEDDDDERTEGNSNSEQDSIRTTITTPSTGTISEVTTTEDTSDTVAKNQWDTTEQVSWRGGLPSRNGCAVDVAWDTARAGFTVRVDLAASFCVSQTNSSAGLRESISYRGYILSTSIMDARLYKVGLTKRKTSLKVCLKILLMCN
ncbi:hypothetical protein FOL47_001426 [Perkinsus chesapeaki]|uniref:Uncharacterized protein n=1 Tax=Perkinsus chesapeaki TaxID=330153 RepID=A0A7J6KTF3_PERCH|nr:hypothetical protein FOL47_001426 [Perkinsus chesapeaki]